MQSNHWNGGNAMAEPAGDPMAIDGGGMRQRMGMHAQADSAWAGGDSGRWAQRSSSGCSDGACGEGRASGTCSACCAAMHTVTAPTHADTCMDWLPMLLAGVAPEVFAELGRLLAAGLPEWKPVVGLVKVEDAMWGLGQAGPAAAAAAAAATAGLVAAAAGEGCGRRAEEEETGGRSREGGGCEWQMVGGFGGSGRRQQEPRQRMPPQRGQRRHHSLRARIEGPEAAAAAIAAAAAAAAAASARAVTAAGSGAGSTSGSAVAWGGGAAAGAAPPPLAGLPRPWLTSPANVANDAAPGAAPTPPASTSRSSPSNSGSALPSFPSSFVGTSSSATTTTAGAAAAAPPPPTRPQRGPTPPLAPDRASPPISTSTPQSSPAKLSMRDSDRALAALLARRPSTVSSCPSQTGFASLTTHPSAAAAAAAAGPFHLHTLLRPDAAAAAAAAIMSRWQNRGLGGAGMQGLGAMGFHGSGPVAVGPSSYSAGLQGVGRASAGGRASHAGSTLFSSSRNPCVRESGSGGVSSSGTSNNSNASNAAPDAPAAPATAMTMDEFLAPVTYLAMLPGVMRGTSRGGEPWGGLGLRGAGGGVNLVSGAEAPGVGNVGSQTASGVRSGTAAVAAGTLEQVAPWRRRGFGKGGGSPGGGGGKALPQTLLPQSQPQPQPQLQPRSLHPAQRPPFPSVPAQRDSLQQLHRQHASQPAAAPVSGPAPPPPPPPPILTAAPVAAAAAAGSGGLSPGWWAAGLPRITSPTADRDPSQPPSPRASGGPHDGRPGGGTPSGSPSSLHPPPKLQPDAGSPHVAGGLCTPGGSAATPRSPSGSFCAASAPVAPAARPGSPSSPAPRARVLHLDSSVLVPGPHSPRAANAPWAAAGSGSPGRSPRAAAAAAAAATAAASAAAAIFGPPSALQQQQQFARLSSSSSSGTRQEAAAAGVAAAGGGGAARAAASAAQSQSQPSQRQRDGLPDPVSPAPLAGGQGVLLLNPFFATTTRAALAPTLAPFQVQRSPSSPLPS